MSDVREIAGLDERESQVLKEWKEKANRRPLALNLSMELFQLFLHGYTCEEIHQQNQVYDFGQILDARLRDGWDRRRHDYLDKLYANLYDRVKQTQAESVAFTTDLLAAAHRLFGTQLRKYMQSGKEEDLGHARDLIKSLEAYRKVADILLKMTGQDKDKDRRPDMLPKTVYVSTDAPVAKPEEAAVVPAAVSQKALPPGTSEVMPPDIAARVLDFFAEKEREREKADGSSD